MITLVLVIILCKLIQVWLLGAPSGSPRSLSTSFLSNLLLPDSSCTACTCLQSTTSSDALSLVQEGGMRPQAPCLGCASAGAVRVRMVSEQSDRTAVARQLVSAQLSAALACA